MFERGDFRVFHEPFIHLYYLGDANKTLKYFNPDPAHPTSYAGVRDMILEAAEHEPVFIKDMCYYVNDYIEGDEEFVKRVRNTFLIRHPEKSIPSYYRLDDEVTRDEIGLDAEYRHFELVTRVTGEVPVVIDGSDIQADTEATMRAYCGAIGLEFLPESLTWERPVPPEWDFVAGWHGDMHNRSGIDGASTAREREKVTIDSAPHLRDYYEYHLPFYLKLRQHRLQIG